MSITEKDISRLAHVIYANDLREIMINTHNNGGTCGLTTYVKEIDAMFRWERKSVNILGGYAGSGKSTILNQLLLLQSIHANKRIGIFTPETYPPEYYYNQLIHSYWGESTEKHHRNQMTLNRHLAGLDWIKDKFFYVSPDFMNDVKPDTIFKVLADLKKDENIDYAVIDPFNQLDRDWEKSQRDDRYVGDFLVQCKRFAIKYDVIMCIVVHPPGSAAKKEKGQEEYKILDMYDFAGGAQWANKSDNMLICYRPFFCRDRKNPESVLKSIRIKKYGFNGYPGEAFLTYNYEKNRYFIYDRDIFSVENVEGEQSIIHLPYADKEEEPDLPF